LTIRRATGTMPLAWNAPSPRKEPRCMGNCYAGLHSALPHPARHCTTIRGNLYPPSVAAGTAADHHRASRESTLSTRVLHVHRQRQARADGACTPAPSRSHEPALAPGLSTTPRAGASLASVRWGESARMPSQPPTRPLRPGGGTMVRSLGLLLCQPFAVLSRPATSPMARVESVPAVPRPGSPCQPCQTIPMPACHRATMSFLRHP
jgi:hypothetical protein